MSVASEITRLQNAKAALKTAIENKGVAVPDSTTLDEYAALVDAISYDGLPAGYTQLAYIESSGTQYINTGIKPTVAKESEIYLKIAYAATTSTQGMGAWGNLVISKEAGNTWRIDGVYTSIPVVIDEVVEIILKQTSSGRFYSIKNESGYGTSNQTANNFCLGTIGGMTTYTMAAKFYKCTIKENDTIVRNLIPAKRNSDNAIGMYDKVSGTFFTNSGTGTFGYGELE